MAANANYIGKYTAAITLSPAPHLDKEDKDHDHDHDCDHQDDRRRPPYTSIANIFFNSWRRIRTPTYIANRQRSVRRDPLVIPLRER